VTTPARREATAGKKRQLKEGGGRTNIKLQKRTSHEARLARVVCDKKSRYGVGEKEPSKIWYGRQRQTKKNEQKPSERGNEGRGGPHDDCGGTGGGFIGQTGR